ALCRRGGREHFDACSNTTFGVDDFEAARSQHGRLALRECRPKLLRGREKQQREIHGSEHKEGPWVRHAASIVEQCEREVAWHGPGSERAASKLFLGFGLV